MMLSDLADHHVGGAAEAWPVVLPAVFRESREQAAWPRQGVAPLRRTDQLFVVTSGLFIARHEFEPALPVAELLFTGDVVAEGVFGGQVPYTVTAITAGSYVALDGDRAQALFTTDPGDVRWLLRSMAIRVKRADNRQTNLMGADVRTRLAGLLLEWCRVHATARLPGPFQGGLARAVIAEVIGTTRASVNRMLQAFERRGVLALHSGGITVVDFDVIARCARGAKPYLYGVRAQSFDTPATIIHRTSA